MGSRLAQPGRIVGSCEAGGLRWHVQQAGDRSAPFLLLLHGTGAATHSWAGFAATAGPPRHRSSRLTCPATASPTGPPDAGTCRWPAWPQPLAELADQVIAVVCPAMRLVGHSAGAAIVARMALDGRITTPTPADQPERRPAAARDTMPMHLFAPLRPACSAPSPLVPRLFAWHAADRQRGGPPATQRPARQSRRRSPRHLRSSLDAPLRSCRARHSP